MELAKEQQDLVRAWAAQGDSISDIQTKLASECGVHLSYMDTRFLLLDLSVTLAERNAKKAEPAPAAPEPAPDGYGAAPPLPGEPEDAAGIPEEESLPPGPEADLPADPATAPAGAGAVQVELARIQRPGFAASGSITCSDGVKGEWGIDAYGRLALAFPDNKGYRPSAADQQAFMERLRSLLSAGY